MYKTREIRTSMCSSKVQARHVSVDWGRITVSGLKGEQGEVAKLWYSKKSMGSFFGHGEPMLI